MLRKLFFLAVSFVLFFSLISQRVFAADPANLKRFGIGWGYTTVDYDLYAPVVTDLGIGWYTDWAPHNTTPKIAEDMAKRGLERLTLVLTRSPYRYYSTEGCNELKKYVSENPGAFKPDVTYWSVGNELGYDPDDLTANKYATEFISWRDCIKSINPNYPVGSGAITSMWVVLPRTYPLSCTDIESANSGKSYFKTYINRIRSLNGNKLPDFIMMHAYNTCYPALPGENTNFSKFKNGIITYRQVMKELGLQNKELWIKEFNSSGYEGDFLKDSFEFLLNTKDKDLGYPEDEYRLVQRFAWFMLKNTPDGINSTSQVLARTDGSLNSLGQTYRSISRKYAGAPKITNSPTPIKTRGDANNDGKVDGADYTIWLLNYGLDKNGPSFGDFNKDGKVDGIDYSIWLSNYQ
ncbi:hypothetical protein HY345_02470 [Candidatus Microgenomates bacterium]|nr:hypothetical protein [Candidatus Microgenomates bacterium]